MWSLVYCVRVCIVCMYVCVCVCVHTRVCVYVNVAAPRESKKRKVASRDHGYMGGVYVVSLRLKLVQTGTYV